MIAQHPLLYGADTLFPEDEGLHLDDAWAERRYRARIWPCIARGSLTLGCGVVGIVASAQGGWSLVVGFACLFWAFWNAFKTHDAWREAHAGFAMLAFVRSAPMRDFLRHWAAHTADRLADNHLSLDGLHPYGHRTEMDYVHGKRIVEAFDHDWFLSAVFAWHDPHTDHTFPRSCLHATLELVGKTGEDDTPFVVTTVARKVEPPVFPEDRRFDRLRRRAAVANLAATLVVLPIDGNPTGSAHGRMAALHSLRHALPKDTP